MSKMTIRELLIRAGADEEFIKEIEKGFKEANESIEAHKRRILSWTKRIRMAKP